MRSKGSKGALGSAAERHAQITLEARGYRFLASNWHCNAGELDLVMLDGDVLVFVEVKARRGDNAGRADDAVSAAKVRRMLAAAEWYVADHPEHQDRLWRCDLVAITIDPRKGTSHVNHYPNAIVAG